MEVASTLPKFAVAFSPDGRQLLVGGIGLRLYDAATGHEIRHFKLEGSGPDIDVWSVAFSSDGKMVASGDWDKFVRVWDLETGKELDRHLRHTRVVTSVVFARDGNQVISGSWDGSVQRWDLVSGQVRLLGEHDNPVLCVASTRDGTRAISGSTKVQNILQEQSSKREGGKPWTSVFPVTSTDILESGLLVLNFKGPSTVRAWNIVDAKELHRFTWHQDGILSLAFSPDGQRVLSGGGTLPVEHHKEPVLQLWDADSGEELRHFDGHSGRVNAVAFSPEGSRAVSGSEDNSVRLWDLDSGKELYRFNGHSEEVTSVAVSPDGQYAASASMDGTVRLWKLPMSQVIKKEIPDPLSPAGTWTGTKEGQVQVEKIVIEKNVFPCSGKVVIHWYGKNPKGPTIFDHPVLWTQKEGELLANLRNEEGIRVIEPDRTFQTLRPFRGSEPIQLVRAKLDGMMLSGTITQVAVPQGTEKELKFNSFRKQK